MDVETVAAVGFEPASYTGDLSGLIEALLTKRDHAANLRVIRIENANCVALRIGRAFVHE